MTRSIHTDQYTSTTIGTLDVDGTQARLGCARPFRTRSDHDASPARPTPPSSPVDARSALLASPSPCAGRLTGHPCPPVRDRAREAGAEGRAEDEGRRALQSEVQDWAIRQTPSATIRAAPPTSTDSTCSREPVATA